MKLWTVGPHTNMRSVLPSHHPQRLLLLAHRVEEHQVAPPSRRHGEPGLYVSLFSSSASLIWRAPGSRSPVACRSRSSRRAWARSPSSWTRWTCSTSTAASGRSATTKGKKRQFVFVTRSPHDGYILMVYAKKKGRAPPVPGKRLLVKEFRTKGGAGRVHGEHAVEAREGIRLLSPQAWTEKHCARFVMVREVGFEPTNA